MAEFVELHARSAFSFLRGSSHPEEMIRRAAQLGMGAMALPDRDGVYGSARAHYAAEEIRNEQNQEIRALVGVEVTLEGEQVVPLLVRTRQGYRNLCQMLTKAKLRGLSEETARAQPFLNPRKDGRVRFDELEEFAEGLVALTGDEDGLLRKALSRGDFSQAEECLVSLINIYGRKNVIAEVYRHGVRGEEWMNRHVIDLAEAHGVMVVCTNRPDFAIGQGRCVADAFTCLRNHVNLDGAGKLLARNAEAHLKGAKQMLEVFRDRLRRAFICAPNFVAEMVRLIAAGLCAPWRLIADADVLRLDPFPLECWLNSI